MMGYGYENAAGDRISALIDMINGGGPGRSGGTFEGGGILSLLANAVAKPYGSVRERPGHTPMGATAAPMEVLPVATGAGVEPVETSVLPATEERLALPGLAEEGYRGAIFRPTFSPAATGGRRFTAEDRALLPSLHPDLAALFSETKVGELLSPQQAMFLDAARVGPVSAPAPVLSPTDAAAGTKSISGSFEPRDPLVPAPTDIPTAQDTAYDYLGDPTFFTPDQLDAMSPGVRAMAEEHNRENLMLASEVFRVPAAPIVSPRPELRPAPRLRPGNIRVILDNRVFDVNPDRMRVVEYFSRNSGREVRDYNDPELYNRILVAAGLAPDAPTLP